MKAFKELYPKAPKSEIFNICVAVRHMSSGHRLSLGTNEDGTVGMKPREKNIGPDLTKIHSSGRRTVFHGLFLSSAIEMISNGPRGRLTEQDYERQEKYNPKELPKFGLYVSKSKPTAGGYPMPQSWSDDQSTKLGEKIANAACLLLDV